jgi:hypothetical protein
MRGDAERLTGPEGRGSICGHALFLRSRDLRKRSLRGELIGGMA